MTEMMSSFASQSPAWMAPSLQGTFSCVTEPISRTTGKAIHSASPSFKAPVHSVIPRSEPRPATTPSTTRLFTSSSAINQALGRDPAAAPAALNLARSPAESNVVDRGKHKHGDRGDNNRQVVQMDHQVAIFARPSVGRAHPGAFGMIDVGWSLGLDHSAGLSSPSPRPDRIGMHETR